MRKIIGSFIFCIVGALLNMIVYNVLISMTGLPLYLDTIFTITVTLICGPLWGILTGALTNIISITAFGLEWYLFAICNIATALITWLFIRFFPLELNLRMNAASAGNVVVTANTAFAAKPLFQTDSRRLSERLSAVMDRLIVLTLLSFALCLVMSILGGCISVLVGFYKASVNPFNAESVNPAAVQTMFHGNIPILLNEILSRIPINIIDRFISVFAAFGAALGARCLMQNIYRRRGE